jgi:hypothetical protein
MCPTKANQTAKELQHHQSIHTSVQNNKRVPAKSLVASAIAQDGCSITSSMAYRAKKLKQQNDDESFEPNFQLIQPFLEELKDLNPGTHTDFQVDEEGRFSRCFLSLGIMKNIMKNATIRVVQLDAAHMKHHIFKYQVARV